MMNALARLDSRLVRYAWIPRLTLILAFIIVIVQAADRRVPYGVVSVEPAFARPGEPVTIKWSIWRDTSRDCNMTLSRSVFDADRTRADYPQSVFSDEAMDAMEKATPGRRSVTIVLPSTAAPGPAELVSTLHYKCNRVQEIWPVTVTTHFPFTILP